MLDPGSALASQVLDLLRSQYADNLSTRAIAVGVLNAGD